MSSSPPGESMLFLTCDIVGSTAYKQRHGSAWQKTFLSFYREFPQMLGDQVRAGASPLTFELWKPIGDELLFTCKVEHEDDIYDAVRIWLAAMAGYETSSLDEERLGTKGGAFIATFPGPDSRCSVPRNPQSEVSDKAVVALNREALLAGDLELFHYDYFGPSIDTGFRVLSSATARHFTLSVEVAWAMLWVGTCANGENNTDRHLNDLDLLGVRDLKGVWGDRDYPLFALDRRHDDPVHQALRELDGSSRDLAHWAELCRACAASDGWPSAIYLPSSSFPPFKNEPSDPLAEFDDNEMEGAEKPPDALKSEPTSDPEVAPVE